MTAYVLSRIFTIGIGNTPTLVFEAQNLREAQELCHEQWLKDELAEAKTDGAPLWDGKANLRARMARPDEGALFTEAKNNGQPSDGLMLAYLVKVDGGETDEQPVDPDAFPPPADFLKKQFPFATLPTGDRNISITRRYPARCWPPAEVASRAR